MSTSFLIYRRWLRDRRMSTAMWTLGLVGIIVLTAAFYPSAGATTGESLEDSSEAIGALLGLSGGVDPSTPLGFLWISLYANVVPWVFIALGIALGTASIAGEEDTGTLEYMLARPVTRTTIAFSRFAAAVTMLFVVAALSAIALIICIPLFELGDSVTTTALDGTMVDAPGATAGDVAAGTFSAFAVGLGLTGLSFLIGGVTGRKGFTSGLSWAIALISYVIYTLAETTGTLETLTWLSAWRWYIDDAMLINGLDWDVLLPFALALFGLLVGWQALLHRDLQNP